MATSAEMTPDERRLVGQVLSDEYSVLMCAQSSAWSGSLTRTSVFIYSLSAAGVTLGFVTGLDQAPFRTLALVVLPLVLLLGIATFVRLVRVQRESVIYVTGMNGSGTSSGRRRRRADRISSCRPTTTRQPCTGGVAWVVAALAFAATIVALFTYGQRSPGPLRAAILPTHPTPPDEIDAPF